MPALSLPSEQLAETSAPSLGRLAIAVVAILLVINLLLVALLARWEGDNDPHVQVTRGKRDALLTMPSAPEILALGDSSGLHGIDAEALGRGLGRPAYNACAFGYLLLLNNLWLCEDLEASARMPRTIVLVHVLDVWTRSERRIDVHLNLVPGWRARAARTELPFSRRIRAPLWALVNAWCPLVDDPEHARPAIAWLFGQPSPRRAVLMPDGRQLIPAPRPASVRRQAEEARESLGDKRWSVSTINRAALDALLECCRRSGTEVFLAPAPVYDGLAATDEFKAATADANTYFRSVAGRHANFHLLAEQPKTFPAEVMQSCDHLATSAAVAEYTSWVEGLLRAAGQAGSGPGGVR